MELGTGDDSTTRGPRRMSGLQANATLMSVDYAVMQCGFVFNLNPCARMGLTPTS